MMIPREMLHALYMEKKIPQNKNVPQVTTTPPKKEANNLPVVERIELRLVYPDGRRELKILVGDEAQKWNTYMREVCEFANEHNKVPDFAGLKWQDLKL